jgi:hypothetical protein
MAEFACFLQNYVSDCQKNERVESIHSLNDKLCKVDSSWIPGSGLGLFASRPSKKGTVICKYYGKLLRTVEAMR